jgi:serine protease Do
MKVRALVGSLAAAGIIAGAGAFAFHASLPIATNANAAVGAAVAPAAAPRPSALPDFAAIVERNGPAVVNISVTQEAPKVAQGPRAAPGDPMQEFFRRFGVPVPQERTPGRGVGSGFIVTPDGLILTNAHVVANASEVTVRLTDKREFVARVVGLDRPTDVAVLKIEAKGLPTVKIGSPDSVRVGEWVAAIGSPYGFENTVTSGIVSAKWRSLPEGTYVPFIQTDVAVNPGNSGGPLFNMNGEVIGINSQIYSRSGGYQGLSFAIPIDIAVKVQGQLVANGKVERGRLGVTIQEVTYKLAESFGLERPAGALVGAVEKGSPAEKAGLEAGDVILGINGRAISSSAELPLAVADLRPGARASLDVWRKGGRRTLDATVGRMPDMQVASAEAPAAPQGRLGVAVRPLTDAEKRQANAPGGVVVEEVAGAAERAGIAPGDLILAINGTAVRSPDELRAAVTKAGRNVALLVQRNSEGVTARLFVPVELG